MPYVHLSASAKMDENVYESVRASIASLMPILPTKTEENTMLHIDGGCRITKGKPGQDCLFVDVHLYQASPFEAKREFVQKVSAALQKCLGTDPARMYFNFTEMTSWGSNGDLKGQ